MTYSHPAAHAAIGARRVAHAIASPLLPDGADAPPSPPEWVELIPAGVFSGRDGRGPYRLDAEAVLAAFAQGGIDLPVDYDHQTLEAPAKAGPVPAAGWIKQLEARAGSLWGRVEWTPKAAELIASREYRFLSPVFRAAKDGRIVALEGAGLTHYPNLDLEPVVHQKGEPMDLKPIIEALGAPADADVAQLAAHAMTLKEAATRQPDPREWVPMSQHQTVAAELAALQAQLAKDKAEAAVREAMRAGKLAPAMQDWATGYATKDPEGFAAWVKAAPVILPVEADKSAHRVASNAGTGADALSDEDRYVCAMLGLAEADFAAHKKTLIKE